MLTVKELSKSFEGRTLFEHVNLEVVGGERIGLLGDNGTGKSTLLKLLLGEEQPDGGKIRFGPTVKIGYLPQIVHFDHMERNLVDTMIYDQDAPPRRHATAWGPLISVGRMCSSRFPPSLAESAAACGFACSWMRRSIC